MFIQHRILFFNVVWFLNGKKGLLWKHISSECQVIGVINFISASGAPEGQFLCIIPTWFLMMWAVLYCTCVDQSNFLHDQAGLAWGGPRAMGVAGGAERTGVWHQRQWKKLRNKRRISTSLHNYDHFISHVYSLSLCTLCDKFNIFVVICGKGHLLKVFVTLLQCRSWQKFAFTVELAPGVTDVISWANEKRTNADSKTHLSEVKS